MQLDALESLWVAVADMIKAADRDKVRKLFEQTDRELARRLSTLLAAVANGAQREAPRPPG
jgi:hypothetical protein